MPTPDEIAASHLKEVTSSRLIADQEIENIVSGMPTINKIISINSFYETCKEIHDNAKLQRGLIGSCEHHVRRGMMHNTVSRVYSDNVHLLEDTNTTYSDWFAERSLDIDSFSSVELEALKNELVQEATGLSLSNTETLASLQQAMISMFKQLSSYSIQFVTDIKGNGIIRLDTPVVRVGDVAARGGNLQFYPFNIIDVKRYNGKGVFDVIYNLSNSNATVNDSSGVHTVKFNNSVNIKVATSAKSSKIKIGIVSTNVRPANPYVPTNTHEVPVLGSQFNNSLDPTSQGSGMNIYTNGFSFNNQPEYVPNGYMDDGYLNLEPSTFATPDLSKARIVSPNDITLVSSSDLLITVAPMVYYGNGVSKLSKLVVEIYEADQYWTGPDTDPAGGTLRVGTTVTVDSSLSYTVPPTLLSGYLNSNRVLHVRTRYVDNMLRYSEWSNFNRLYFTLP